MKYTIQGKEIEIDTNDLVFKPSQHGSTISNFIKINPGEKVLDIGTGTGFLAILAAKLGGKVFATDILPQAVKLAKHNADKNSVSVDVRLGDMFEPFAGEKFDVIIANVPQEVLSPKIVASLPKEVVTGMSGGKNGNELLLRVLNLAPEFMHKDSRLYVVAYSMSNYRESLKIILDKYQAKLINFYTSPVKDFLYSDPEYYLDQLKEGTILIYKKGSEYWADLFVFELKLK